MASGDFKDLARRTASDKVLRGKSFNFAKNPKYHGYQRGLASMVYKLFDKKLPGVTTLSNSQRPLDLARQQFAEDLHKPVLLKIFKKEKFILHSKTIFRVLI